MIKTTKIHTCTKCNRVDIVKNGTAKNGKQKFHCATCAAWGTLAPSVPYTEESKEEILRTYQERPSMRGIERIFNVARQTLARWLTAKAASLPDLSATLDEAKAEEVLELAELWSYVLQKVSKRWVWIALCRRTRQIVAYFIGDRSEKSCRELWKRIPESYKKCCSYSDFWDAYQKVFSAETH